jgi:tRNA A-37 threonylcarbamoyl transferase component Bud32
VISAGSTIGNYRVLQLIGAGGMGSVYLAEHVLIGRRAAIKVLHPELSQKSELVERFLNEAKATAAIGAPGIVQIFDFGTHDDGMAYIVMELLEGESLAVRLRKGPLPPDKALGLIRQICAALGVAHAAGIIHRDLKPENIYLVADPELPDGERSKLLDFGIAKVQREPLSGRTTAEGVVMGSPMYMSPEQCRGVSQRLDRRTDIYSLGCIFFEVLTGQPPFRGPSPGELIAAHLTEAPPAPSSLAPWITDELDAIILCCLAKRAEERFASCDLLIAALDDALLRGDEALAGEGPDEAGERPGGKPRALSQLFHRTSAALERRIVSATVAASPVPGAAPTILFDVRGLQTGVSVAGAEVDEPKPRTEAELLSDVLTAALPRGLKDADRLLYAFFSELFTAAEPVRDGLLRLRAAAAIRDLAEREHFAIFVDEVARVSDEPLGQLGTVVFQTRINPLAAAIEQARAPSGSVLIVVTAASQLGKGVREIIFNLRRDKGLFVVPLALPEIQRVAGRKEARLLLLNRVADLHSVSDPFSILEPSTDPTRCVGFASEVLSLVNYISDGGHIVNIVGPPGSGKSTVVAMAEYGCGEANVIREYIHLDCTKLPRDPQEVASELRARVQAARTPVRQHFEKTLIAGPGAPARAARPARVGRPRRRPASAARTR